MLLALVVFTGLGTGFAREEAWGGATPLPEGLPRVLVLGDSISFQYRPYVTEYLKGKARVFWLVNEKGAKVNGGDTKRALGNVPGVSLPWRAGAGT